MIDSNNQFNKLSKSLLDAVRGVMEAKDGTHPKNEKEKDLAAKAPPHDKITHADVLAARGVLKKHPTTGKLVTKEETEEVENIDEALDAAARYGQHHTAIKELMKSISQHIESHKNDALKHRDYRGKKGVHWGHVGDVAQVHSQLADIHDRLAQQGEYKATMGESVEAPEGEQITEAPIDGVAPGSMNNDGHLCATKVFHKEWAEGTPIYSQHAEPDADGNIAWYDVMFEHGIEKQVATDDLDILMSETHERHGKRKMKEDVESIQELSNKTLSSYTDKAAKERDTFHADRNKTADAARKYFNRKAGVRKALEVTKEEVEDLEELSKDTVRNYYNKAGEQGRKIMGKMAVGGGDWSKDGSDTKTLKKREAGRKMALKRRSGEVKMSEEAEQIDELSKDKMLKYLSANKKSDTAAQEKGDYSKSVKRMRGTDLAVRKYTAGPNSKYVRVPATNEDVELDEARGRPRKNPLPTGQSDEPEPRQHIIQQLQRAKLSMRGGEHVTFKDGTKHMVPGHHAEKILAKYSAMKPAGKEEFQKKISASHAAFKEEL